MPLVVCSPVFKILVLVLREVFAVIVVLPLVDLNVGDRDDLGQQQHQEDGENVFSHNFHERALSYAEGAPCFVR